MAEAGSPDLRTVLVRATRLGRRRVSDEEKRAHGKGKQRGSENPHKASMRRKVRAAHGVSAPDCCVQNFEP